MISQRTRQLVSTVTVLCSTSVRNYGRRVIKAKAVSNINVNRRDNRYPKPKGEYGQAQNRNGFDELEPDVVEAFETLDHSAHPEPDLRKLASMHTFHEKEMLYHRHVSKRWRVVNKHFKQFMKSDISLLTYAEKEQIRYLYNTDPEEWSEENLAAAFPISIESLRKLLKSPLRCLTVAEIKDHDARVKKQLEQIQNGEIELTPELEEKMAIRKSIPINLGAISTPETGLLVKEKQKTLGPFARLVTPNAPPIDVDLQTDEHDTVKCSEFSHRNQRSTKQNQNPLNSKTKGMNIKEQENKVQGSEAEYKMLALMRRGPLTLKEFEEEVRRVQKSGTVNVILPEIEQKKFDYLLNVSKSKQAPQQVHPALPGSDEYVAKPEDFIERSHFRKFANSSPETIEVNVENGEAYIYEAETGVQKPFASVQQRIRLPKNCKKEGSVYKVGNSYYDENGDFLYRPI